ncbi:hypothetical protein HF1_10240 [Mycoplasma haemofelis str. Langford 1]|uniref:Uncharacterized protein n=1 Tax=Mycoplasma haemofelis (strain Langford 1) TaxID=941640 RepID=E8ZIR1_MYCHL|nr:hypothetical protein [Mycoplasma haemofelis]CBY93032.1 hypothetical protein HF1_10240 [Mycoplasma haemofelis str. Langford 1]
MAYQILKMATLSGGCAVAGGGIAGGFLISSSKEGKSNSIKTASSALEGNNFSEPATPKKACILYVATGITGNKETTKVSEITQKFTGDEIEEFLKDKKEGGSFASDVQKACEGKNKNFPLEDNLNVFVYKETTGNQRWIYSQYLQKDWFQESTVRQTFDTASGTVAPEH